MDIASDLFISRQRQEQQWMGCLAITDAAGSICCVLAATFHRDGSPSEESVSDVLTPGYSLKMNVLT